MRAGACVAAVVAALWGVVGGGCRDHRSDKPPRQFFPDLDDQMKWKPQTETPFYADGRSMRPRPEGVVAYASFPLDPAWSPGSPAAQAFAADRARVLKEDEAFYRGTDGVSETDEPNYLAYMPVPVTRELIERGRQRFDIYCAVCHGYAGEGNGMVGQRWAYAPANFHDVAKGYLDRAQRTGKDGYIFSVIRNGIPNTPAVREEPITLPDGTPGVRTSPSYRMPPYGHAVDEADAWAIVAYVRALQASYVGSIDDVPQGEREVLLRSRPPEPPPPVKPGDVPTPAGGNP